MYRKICECIYHESIKNRKRPAAQFCSRSFYSLTTHYAGGMTLFSGSVLDPLHRRAAIQAIVGGSVQFPIMYGTIGVRAPEVAGFILLFSTGYLFDFFVINVHNSCLMWLPYILEYAGGLTTLQSPRSKNRADADIRPCVIQSLYWKPGESPLALAVGSVNPPGGRKIIYRPFSAHTGKGTGPSELLRTC